MRGEGRVVDASGWCRSLCGYEDGVRIEGLPVVELACCLHFAVLASLSLCP